MKNSLRRLTPLALSLVLGLPALAAAKDLCIASSGVDFAVLRKFHRPSPGMCAPVSGNFTTGFGILSGTACTRSDGAELQLLWVAQNAFLDSFQTLVTLPLPAMTGGSGVNKINFNINGSSLSNLSAATCKGQPVQ